MLPQALFAIYGGASGTAFRAAVRSVRRGRAEFKTGIAMWPGDDRGHDGRGREVRFRRAPGRYLQNRDAEQDVAPARSEMRRARLRVGEITIRKAGPDSGRLSAECRNGLISRRL